MPVLHHCVDPLLLAADKLVVFVREQERLLLVLQVPAGRDCLQADR